MAARLASDDLYQVSGTFMGVPAGRDPAGSRVAVLGLPFDMGVHPTRIGSRQGPDAIRAQSGLVRRFLPEFDDDPVERLGLIDLGNVRLTASRVEEAQAQIQRALRPLVEAGTIPLTMGGDGSVTLPQLRALHAHHGRLALLHFDAHTDSYPAGEGADRYTTGNTFRHALEERLLDVEHALHVGIRGSTYRGGAIAQARADGFEVIGLDQCFEMGLADLVAHLHARLADRLVYLCWDMDFFDPSAAPGVCTPAWGGVSAREGLYILRRLAGLRFVGFDVNTVSPPHDIGGLTAALAGRVMLEMLFLACQDPRLAG